MRNVALHRPTLIKKKVEQKCKVIMTLFDMSFQLLPRDRCSARQDWTIQNYQLNKTHLYHKSDICIKNLLNCNVQDAN